MSFHFAREIELPQLFKLACAGLLLSVAIALTPPATHAWIDLRDAGRIVLVGEETGDRAGAPVSSAGDFNGDGRPDLAVGAPEARGASGAAYVVFGRRDGQHVDLGSLGSKGVRIEGASLDDRTAGVAEAGDVNGDGKDDLLLGAPGTDGPSGVDSGAAYVVFGRSGGGTIQLGNLGGGGFRIDGASGGESSGSAIAGVGDVNRDGRADLAVGAPGGGSVPFSHSGRVYVVFGKPDTSTVNLQSLGGAGYVIEGGAVNDSAGAHIARGGDLNRDGRGDVLLTAGGADNNGRADSGSVYVVFGKEDSNPVLLSALDTNGYRIDGAAPDDRVGAVAGGGDVNGDGHLDIIVGAPAADNNGRVDSGSVYVVFGSVNHPDVDLAALGSRGFRIDGARGGIGDLAGASVGLVPDVNGDGRADVLVGAPLADNGNRSDSGSTYVVFGEATARSLDLRRPLGRRGVRIDGAGESDAAGHSVSRLGDLDQDGFADLLVGSPLARNQQGNRSGAAFVVTAPALDFLSDSIDTDGRGYVELPVRCVRASGCRGTLRLTLATGRASGNTSASLATRVHFRLRAGERTSLRMRLTPDGWRRVKRRGRVSGIARSVTNTVKKRASTRDVKTLRIRR